MTVKFLQLIFLALNYMSGSLNEEYNGNQTYGHPFSYKPYSMREADR